MLSSRSKISPLPNSSQDKICIDRVLSTAGKQTKLLYPHQYPLQELGEAPKVEYNNTDGVPRVTNSYLYVSPRDAQELTIFYRGVSLVLFDHF